MRANGLGHPFGSFPVVQIVDANIGAIASERHGDGPADSLLSSRHQDYLPIDPHLSLAIWTGHPSIPPPFMIGSRPCRTSCHWTDHSLLMKSWFHSTAFLKLWI